MLQMRYKNFIWPNNPHTCTLRILRDVASYKYPGNSYRLESMGMAQRTLSGEGEFYGQDAYGTMKKLMRVFESEGAGHLLHPVIELNLAVFSELELLQEPRKDYVAYRFVFLEDGLGMSTADGTGNISGVHTVKNGQTLWEISNLYGLSTEQLLGLNPWIQNPNYLTAGRQVALT